MEKRLTAKLKAAARRYGKERDYWLRQFSAAEQPLKTHFPYDGSQEGPSPGDTFETFAFKVSPELFAGLMRIGNKNDRALHVILTAGLAALLYRYAGNPVILLGTPIYKPGLEEDLINTVLVLKSRFNPSMTFKDLLLQVRATITKAVEHQNYPVELLPEQLALPYTEEEDFPLFDTALVLENLQAGEYLQHLKHSMTLSFLRTGTGLAGEVRYNPRRFTSATIHRVANHLQQFLLTATQQPELRAVEIDFLSPAEKQQLLVDFNETNADYPRDKTLHELFARQARRTPHQVALIGQIPNSQFPIPNQDVPFGQELNACGEVRISYGELQEKSRQVACLLIEKGVVPDTIVAIMVERSIRMVIGILGILKAGGAYLPIDPRYPQNRIDFMLKDSSAKLFLTDHDLSSWLASAPRALLNPFAGHLFNFPTSRPSSLSYLIYTSGSTGKPKGVSIRHDSAVNRLHWMQRTYPLDSRDVILQKTPYTFDVSVWELFWWFFNGAALCLLAPGEEKNPEAIIKAVEQQGITTMHFVPSMFSAFLDYLAAAGASPRLASLRQLFCSGESLTPHLVKKFNRIIPQQAQTRLVNLYGPTEATVDVSYYNCPRRENPGNSPIGKPIDNIRLYILDQELQLLPLGVPGELCISGIGLARGYLNNPELTAEKFCRRRQKIYRTGDLARWLPDGNIEFLGRIDHQVKIRGFRIEPGEIENRLKEHEQVKEATVVLKEKQGETYLCAYLVPAAGASVDGAPQDEALRAHLSKQLPSYMVPSHFVRLETLPLTSSGKLDRQALPDPETAASLSPADRGLPANRVERILLEVFQQVLGRELMGTHENFFTAGADSIKLIRAAARLRKAGYTVQMNNFFRYPTAARLAPAVKKLHRAADQGAVQGQVPLTPIQAAFFHHFTTAPHHYNQAVMLYAAEGFDTAALEAVFKKIFDHHDALRMVYRFQEDTGQIRQINREPGHPPWLRVYDFRDQSMTAAVTALESEAGIIQASFDLETGPLMKLGLFRLPDGDRLLMVSHHLVMDGVSWRILFEDLGTLYQQYKNRDPLTLPLKTDSFKTWSQQLHQYAGSPSLLKEIPFWTELETLSLPVLEPDFVIPGNAVKDTGTLEFELSREETRHLLTGVHEAFATEINDILLTALALAVKRTHGLQPLLVALEGHGREEIFKDVHLSRTVGWFTSVYPVVLDTGSRRNLSRQVQEIKETLRRIPRRGIGYGILRFLTSPDHKKGLEFQLKPQVCFNYLGQFDADIARMSFAMAREARGNRQSPENPREYEWEISGLVSENRLVMSITYNRQHFKKESVQGLVNAYREELLRVIRHCLTVRPGELTPSDLTYKKLSIDTLAGLSARYQLGDLYPLTPMQEGMLLHALLNPSSAAYFEQISYRLRGRLEIPLVEESLNELLKRHAVLRTAFIHEFPGLDRPLQIVLKHRAVDFDYQDLRTPGQNRDAETLAQDLEEFKKKDRQRSFKLSTDVLLRAAILQWDDCEYEFTWSFHHIVMDGWCTGILTLEFLEIYSALLEKRPYRLPAVTPYREYISWLEEQEKDRSRDYWKIYLQGYDEPAGIPRRPPAPDQTAASPPLYRKEQVVLRLDPDKTDALNRLAGKSQVTLNTILQALWGIILGRCAGKRDVVFGVVVSGRPPEIEGVESMIGLFIHTLPVRLKLDTPFTFRHLLHQLRAAALASEPHHYYPLAKIQALSDLKTHLLDHVFVFENYPIAQHLEEVFQGSEKNREKLALRVSAVEVFEQAAYDLGIRVSPGPSVKIEFIYNAHVYDRDILQRVSCHLNHLIRQVLDNEEQRIHAMTLLTPEEKREILSDFNDTAREFPLDRTIHGTFAEQTGKNPDQIALVGKLQITNPKSQKPNYHLTGSEAQLSYGELQEKSNGLAYRLTRQGVEPGTIVAIKLERSLELFIGLLGILKAGGAYLPIDTEYPQERINYMLKDSGAKMHVTTGNLAKEGEKNFEIRFLDTHSSLTFDRPNFLTSQLPDFPLSPATGHWQPATSLAYLIYTSGSTGKPKGVLIRHRGVVNLVYGYRELFAATGQDRVSQVASPGFDAMAFETWPCLLSGATLCIAAQEIRLDPAAMKTWLIEHCITLAFQPTVMAERLLQEEWPRQHLALRALTTAGDRLTVYPPHDDYPFRFYNLYGPTEDTVWTTCTEVTARDRKARYPDIGKPIGNKRVYILDANLQLQPIYIAGELSISGIGLAPGYLNNPELTAERFIAFYYRSYKSDKSDKSYLSQDKNHPGHPTLNTGHSTLYRTGDLARWLPGGSIEFLGRVDRQVKIRGFRIEPGEIENRLLKHEQVNEAVIAAIKDRRGEKALCAYIVPAGRGGSGKKLDTTGLKQYLAGTLPDYMIPVYWVPLDQVPLTPNGKIDRNRLPAPDPGTGRVLALPSRAPEEIMARIWQEVLQLENVGIHDNFFDLGGNSMDIIRVNNRLKEALGLEIPLVTLFRYPTIRQLAEALLPEETGKPLPSAAANQQPAGRGSSGEMSREIAVIGMSARFPGARDLYEFWENLRQGIESISFFTAAELAEAGEEPAAANKTNYVKARAVLEDKACFDAGFFGYIPTEAETLDPQMRIFHESAWEALEDAGYNPGAYPGLIGLYAGASNNFNWEALSVLAGKPAALGQFAWGQLTNKDFLSARVSYKLDLKGPVLAVQTACSTSLAAIHLACRTLLGGECDMALAGGITILGTAKTGYLYQEGMILSPDGHCRAFDARAKGTVSGEGAGLVLLKPVENAIADGDHIYALVKGSALNNDGSDRVGFSAPGPEGQARVIRQAQAAAGLEPETIGYIETHGTATALGDPIEIQALTLAFATAKTGFCALGSVKTNLGHLDSAAGVAGFIKTVLALTHGSIPPSLHVETPNPVIDFNHSPFYVNREPREWKPAEHPRRAGVSAFGIGGTNVHVVLEEFRQQPGGAPSRPHRLLLLSAKTPAALDKMTANLVEHFKKNPDLDLADAAYTLQAGRKGFNHRRMAVASTTTDAIAALTASEPGNNSVPAAPAPEAQPRICFMFAGLGAQYVDMGRDLYRSEPIFRQEADRCFEILKPLLDVDIKEILYPAQPLDAAPIDQFEIAQAVVFILEYALTRCVMAWGITPAAVIGYSFGEYTAACIAGVFSLEDALKLVVIRGRLMKNIPPGSMLSVPLDQEALAPLLPAGLSLAIANGPSSIVSGPCDAVAAFEKTLKKKGYLTVRLQATRALHSPMMDPVLQEFEKEVGRVVLNKPQIACISNVTGQWLSPRQAADPAYWSSHLRQTVRFADGIRRILANPAALLVEIGPGRDLTTLVTRFTGNQPKAVNLVRPPGQAVSDTYYLLNRMGRLWLYGQDLDINGAYSGEKRLRISLPTYPFEKQVYPFPVGNLAAYAETLKHSAPASPAQLADWFYIPSWSLSSTALLQAPPPTNPAVTSTWLVLPDDEETGIASLLAARLRNQGHGVVTVKQGLEFETAVPPGRDGFPAFTLDPADPAHYRRLFRELHSHGIFPLQVVHCWSLNRAPGDSSQEPGEVRHRWQAFEKAQQTGFYPLLYLAAQLGREGLEGREGPEGPVHLTVVANHLLEVTGAEEGSPPKATLLGLLKVIPQEHPNLRCRCIDVVLPEPGDSRQEKLLAQLEEELANHSSHRPFEPTIALRGDQRWVPDYTPLHLEEPQPHTLPLKEKGVYLLSGGLGNIGFILAEYLARSVRARLVLTGRSFCPLDREQRQQWLSAHPLQAKDPGNPVNRRIEKVNQLEALGAEVLVFGADVAHLGQMQAVIAKTGEHWGEIHGVIHAAGLIGGSSFTVLENLEKSACQEQFQAKVYGSLVLAHLFQGKDLDFCWMMSSIAAVLGGLRFAAYAAANSFVDALVKNYNRCRRKPWKSIAWEALEPQHTTAAFERILAREKLTAVVVARGGDLPARIHRWIKLESLHPNGPVNQKPAAALRPRPALMNPYLEPRTPLEQTLTHTWQQLFGFHRIGIRDDFFELGGDSLKAITAIARLHKVLGIEIPLTEFFKRLTVEALAEYIAGAKASAYSLIEPAEAKEYYGLSPGQRRMYLLHRLDSDSLGYNETQTALLEGKPDKNKLQRAFRELIRRHESLRTSFIEIDGTPMQRIHHHHKVSFNLNHFPPGKSEVFGGPGTFFQKGSWWPKAILRNFLRPFDLSRAPLFRVALIGSGENLHLLVFDIHHIITDGVSHQHLIRRFMSYYARESETSLPGDFHPRLQYRDYAQWQNSPPQASLLAQQETYWLDRFKGEIPVLHLPYDFPRPNTRSFAGGTLTFVIDPGETRKIKALASRAEVSLFMFWLAVLNILLSRYSGQEDIVIGTGTAGRRHEDLREIIGLFVNTLPLRNRPGAEKPFLHFLQEVKACTLDAFSHQEYPFEDLVEKISPQRDPGRNPLFDILLMFQDLEIPALEIPGLRLTPYGYDRKVSKFDITFSVFEAGEEIRFSCQYCTDLFKEETVQRLIDSFKRIAAELLQGPAVRIADIEILSPQEKQWLLVDLNQTQTRFPQEKTLHGLFAAQVGRTPDRVAITGAPGANSDACGEVRLSYRELQKQSGLLAASLQQRGVVPDTLVGIMSQRSIRLIIGILGILKAGGAYLPIDPGYPPERIEFMLKDSSAKLLVTTGNLAQEGEKVRWWAGEKILLEKIPGFSRCSTHPLTLLPSYLQNASNPAAGHRPPATSLAYLIYTSGSTGTPRGVMISHQSAVNYTWWAAQNYLKGEPLDFPLFTSISFDLTVTSIFTPLASGNKILVYHQGSGENVLEKIIHHNQVGIIKCTPAHLSLIPHKKGNNTAPKSKLKRLLVGGETLETHIARAIHENFQGEIEIYNEYGPTEAAVGCMIYRYNPEKDQGTTVPIGVPAANTRVYLLDKNQNPVPRGTPGEIYLAGTGLARGYLNQPELSNERFCLRRPGGLFSRKPPPWTPRKSVLLKPSTLYKTGDLARWLADGNLEFLGRLDHQVKIRGFRVEPEEIEQQLLAHEQVKDAVLTAPRDHAGERSLCAYYVSEKELPAAGLREFLSQRLPGYMIPSYFIRLDTIPLTLHGKVNRDALPKPGLTGTQVYQAPRNPVEEKLVRLWEEILARTPVGIDDRFFELGGHSLKALRLTSHIHREFNVKLPLADVFKMPTIRGLAAYIQRAGQEEYRSINPAEKREYYELSSAQKRLYFFHQVDPENTAYHMSMVLAVTGEPEGSRLEKTFQRLIRRHDSLRTSFITVNGEPVQRTHDQVEFEILNRFAKDTDNTKISHHSSFIIHHSFIRPFELSRAPLLRVGLIKIENREHIMVVDMHHIISDGISLQNLVKEFTLLYGHPDRELALLPLCYKDFAHWQNRLAASRGLEAQAHYWKTGFSGEIPVLHPPLDYPRPALLDFAGDKLGFRLDPEAAGALRQIALEEDASLFMVLLTLYYVFLFKLCGQEDIVVGVPGAGRRHPDLEPVIGMFVNTLALRNFPCAEKPLRQFLQEVKENALQAFENQDYQFETLVEKIAVPRDTSRNPLFDTMLVLQNQEVSPPINPAEKNKPPFTVKPHGYTRKTSRFDLTLEASEQENSLLFSFEYRTALFKKETIARFSGYFTRLVTSIRHDPGKPLQDIEIIPDAEKKKLVEEFNNTAVDYPGLKDKTIHRLFREQVNRTPGQTALVGSKAAERKSIHLTYGELNEDSDQRAKQLQAKGVGPDTIVAIMVKRSVELIVGLLAILKAGGAYMPVDPNYPPERIDFMLKDSITKILLTTEPAAKTLHFDEEMIVLSAGRPSKFPSSPSPLFPTSPSASLAYVIYTSGSTGRPKGVLIGHSGVLNLVRFHRGVFGESCRSRFSQAAGVAFDAMAFETWPCLLAGAALCIIDGAIPGDPRQLREWLIRCQITISFQPTPVAQQLLEEQWPENGVALKALRAAGDRLTTYPAHPYPFLIYNLYGPTEDTIWTTWTTLKSLAPSGHNSPPPIGKPVANKQVYILSTALQLQPMGVPGELCISGAGIARGYLNRPELTAEKFCLRRPGGRFLKKPKDGPKGHNRLGVPPPFYKTGDLARWLPDGNIEFLGRTDFQVKIRGFRIELAEIENRLLEHREIKAAVVIDRVKKSAEKYLCAYLVAENALNVSTLRHSLAKHLPDYMIPSYFIQLKEIPLTPNGKVDRHRLPLPGETPGSGYVAPKSDNEKIIAGTWKEVLELDRVGIDDNFFELGGNSLNIIKVHTCLKEVFKKEIPVVYLFKYPTIRSFAHYLHQEDYTRVIRRTDQQQKGKNRVKEIRGRKKEARSIQHE